MDCNFVRTVALRVIAAALAVVCGVDSASAGFFRIAFKDNGTTTETTQALLATNINKDIANYLTSGSQYISAFDRSTFQYIYQARRLFRAGLNASHNENDNPKDQSLKFFFESERFPHPNLCEFRLFRLSRCCQAPNRHKVAAKCHTKH